MLKPISESGAAMPRCAITASAWRVRECSEDADMSPPVSPCPMQSKQVMPTPRDSSDWRRMENLLRALAPAPCSNNTLPRSPSLASPRSSAPLKATENVSESGKSGKRTDTDQQAMPEHGKG